MHVGRSITADPETTRWSRGDASNEQRQAKPLVAPSSVVVQTFSAVRIFELRLFKRNHVGRFVFRHVVVQIADYFLLKRVFFFFGDRQLDRHELLFWQLEIDYLLLRTVTKLNDTENEQTHANYVKIA